jgi:hypothetical protein
MVVSHASGACVKLDPYGPQLAVNSCIIFEVDDLALAVCWLDALAEVGHRGVNPAPDFFLPHPHCLSIHKHHPVQQVPELLKKLLAHVGPF